MKRTTWVLLALTILIACGGGGWLVRSGIGPKSHNDLSDPVFTPIAIGRALAFSWSPVTLSICALAGNGSTRLMNTMARRATRLIRRPMPILSRAAVCLGVFSWAGSERRGIPLSLDADVPSSLLTGVCCIFASTMIF